MTSTKTFNWREEVEKIDGPNRHTDSLYPIVYTFSGARPRRDSGPESGIYEKP
ncbi:MAG: hypothetical protein OEX14_00155 [Paracoccaceae bacterium]|nr:hypothetical protein [Paracoccaceae bacterium]